MEIVIWYPKSTFDLQRLYPSHAHTYIIYACITYKINTKAKDVAQW